MIPFSYSFFFFSNPIPETPYGLRPRFARNQYKTPKLCHLGKGNETKPNVPPATGHPPIFTKLHLTEYFTTNKLFSCLPPATGTGFFGASKNTHCEYLLGKNFEICRVCRVKRFSKWGGGRENQFL